MSDSDDPVGTVRAYIDAFNSADAHGMSAACADPMQILDGMSPHVWQGPTAVQDWWRDALAEGEHLDVTDYHIVLGIPRHVDITGDYAYVVAPVTFSFTVKGEPVTQTDALFTAALRRESAGWKLSAWAWSKDFQSSAQAESTS